jgi:hypothetical protein
MGQFHGGPRGQAVFQAQSLDSWKPTTNRRAKTQRSKAAKKKTLRSLPLGVFALKKRVRFILSTGTKQLQAVAKNRGGNWATRCAKTYDRTFLRCRFVPRLAAANFGTQQILALLAMGRLLTLGSAQCS